MKYTIIEKKTLLDIQYANLEEAKIRVDTFTGDPIEITRLGVVRPPVVAILLFRPENDCFVLVRQFRYSALSQPDPWVTEIVAGVVDDTDITPAACAIRESVEETGYRPQSPEAIQMYMPSVGFSDQRVHMFYADVSSRDRVAEGGGLSDETEDIDVLEVPFTTMLAQYKRGEIYDAKTLLAFQWFLIHKKNGTA